MKIVYLCGPIAKSCGSDAKKRLNVERGLDATERILRAGFLTVSPFLLANFVIGKHLTPPPVQDMYIYSKKLLSVCDYLVIVGDVGKSIGASHEIGFAHGRNIPVFNDVEEFLEFSRRGQQAAESGDQT